jgi:hypothetical protein
MSIEAYGEPSALFLLASDAPELLTRQSLAIKRY